jgi:hypothetical protein
MLRPLCFAKWDKLFTFRDSNGPIGSLIAVFATAIGMVVQVSLCLAPSMLTATSTAGPRARKSNFAPEPNQ